MNLFHLFMALGNLFTSLKVLTKTTDGLHAQQPKIVNFEDVGGVPSNYLLATCRQNSLLFNQTIHNLPKNAIFVIPSQKIFCLLGGIKVHELSDITIQIDGTLEFSENILAWPRDPIAHQFEDGLHFERCHNITFTSTLASSNKGVIDGSGRLWWGYKRYIGIVNYRPRLLVIHNSTDILVEKILLKNSPKSALYAKDIANLEIRHTDVDIRRRPHAQWHDSYELKAVDTDGFVISGKNVWIHDCNIWTDADCISVKQQDPDSFNSFCSENMLFERINASGGGLAIGSIQPSPHHSCVRNITFRNSTMFNTLKGIYLKSSPGKEGHTGEITDILYENIRIKNASEWAIWIGPEQTSVKGACSLMEPFSLDTSFPMPSGITWNNITLKNIMIINPQCSPGVIIGNASNLMRNILFDNVFVKNPGEEPWKSQYYACYNVDGRAQGNTVPQLPCFYRSEI